MSAIVGYEIFHFVTDAILFITLVASICFTICAALRLRRRRDHARRVFSWVKIAWVMQTIAVFFSLLEIATVTLVSRVYQSNYDYLDDETTEEDPLVLVTRIATGASALSLCFNVFAELTIFLTLASLIRCIRYIAPRDEKHIRRHKWSRYSAYAVSFGICILSLAVLSVELYHIVLSEIISSTNGIAWDRLYNNYYVASAIMNLTCQAVLAFLAISMLVRSCLLRRKLRSSKSLQKPLRYLIACCSVWIVRAAFDIYSIIFQTVSPFLFTPFVEAGSSFNEILSVILKTWPLFIILVILYYLGLEKKTGLSSTGTSLLLGDRESQVASSEFLSPEPTIATPMTERAVTPALSPVHQRPESLFSCDGVADAPPEYSPPASHHVVSSVTATSLLHVPIIRRPIPPSASQATDEMTRLSGEGHELSANQPGTITHQAAVPSVSNSSPQSSQLSQRSLDELVPQLPSTTEDDDESLGLYHQADGRMPQSELSSSLPSHDEAMGLYHQADGRPPTSEADSSVLPSHEESMGLFHQADGRPPGSSSSDVPPESSNAALFSSFAATPDTMSAPPSHDEAMGLYHQADGRVPLSEVLPPEKDTKKK
ncbi:hypothetical protein ISF_02615 [Cordyceps fumosorosea ARSEF 2679]|uniref:Uncharacterized protein n=1 Tax=Cordyceps fumosorosea (strain ARSEF 2679) TaxID=1081104 RepID=A0A168BWM8_CORFA|nr:hypothetical protein ISF_02615 [Cordyceps fumosorosea ARSEF 2679]OAA70641.1 hypothetical protein ISF_02615 [Cordyceps fumosorosea ARSEF 2679]